MKQNTSGRRGKRHWPLLLLGGLLLLFAALLLLQLGWAHRTPAFEPDYPQVELSPFLEAEPLQRDYHTIFRQTGLAKPAVDTLLARGEVGKAQLILAQEQFFQPRRTKCLPLFSVFTMEDRLQSEDGSPDYGPYLPALEDGDIILTFSTHSLGWRHGHAGIVIDAQEGVTLEAAVIGTDAQQMDVGHWRTYSNFMVLRLRDMTPRLQAELVDYCLESLDGTPYRLASGLFGDKAPDLEETGFGVQCSYLVWYAFQYLGYDVDADGGRLVTVADLAVSPLFEVVQIFGMDPEVFSASDQVPSLPAPSLIP